MTNQLTRWTPSLIRWSLRKAFLPIRTSDRVLDVGSGANPHPSADVLVESDLTGAHRYGMAAVFDRPAVLADGCRLPFKNKSFDYVMAFHVLEHMTNPSAFLLELQRVGRAGYIETPNCLFERLVPYDTHVLEVADSSGELVLHKKASKQPDALLNRWRLIDRDPRWRRLFYSRPELFHVRFFWKDTIPFRVLNDDLDVSWHREQISKNGSDESHSVSDLSLRALGLKVLRSVNTTLKRSRVDLGDLLACPDCHGDLIVNDKGEYECRSCARAYPSAPVPDFRIHRSI